MRGLGIRAPGIFPSMNVSGPGMPNAYYVDATNGNDANGGRSSSDAWQTIAKVNAATFLPGDRILFKRGETWVGAAIVPPSSGAAGSPIEFADYGAGAPPIIDGNDASNCIFCSGRSYLRFENLDLTQGFDAGFHFDTSHHIDVIDCDAHDAGNDNLIFITTCYACTVTRGSFYNGYQRVVGPQITGIEIADGCYDITLTDVICYDNIGGAAASGVGISIHSHVATVIPYNITVIGAECYGNSYAGIQVWKQNNVVETDRAIRITNCHTHTNGSVGIRVYKSAAIANFPNGVVIDGCHSEGNTTYAYYLQGDDLRMQRSVLEGQGLCAECVRPRLYNNTFYFTTVMWEFPVFFSAVRTDDVECINSIIYRGWGAGGEAPIGTSAPVVNPVDIDYTLYYLVNEGVANTRWQWQGVNKNYADWLTDSGQDANSPAVQDVDPLFVNPGADDFRLQAGSPARGVGIDVGFGTDLGAYQYEA